MGLFSEHGIEHGPDADCIVGEAIITNTIDLRGDGLLSFHCCRRLIKRVLFDHVSIE
jgi:hypothetical protein